MIRQYLKNVILLAAVFLSSSYLIKANVTAGYFLSAIRFEDKTYEIPLAGNAFFTYKDSRAKESISNVGLTNWAAPSTVTSIYFRTSKTGTFFLKLRAKAPEGQKSKVRVSVGERSEEVELSSPDFGEINVGAFNVVDEGYVQVSVQGLNTSGNSYGEISHLLISGEAVADGVLYSDDPNYYYWARRGPSCHINYNVSGISDATYYYNEITIPEGEDKIGSYFMAIGFGQGYFGIQVNSERERRILFSVWSPFHTDDPKTIPDDQKIVLNKKGTDVHTGEFGNEGSGGQSYLRYHWKAGITYRFLLKGNPDGNDHTDYSAWFFNPDTQQWQIVASFKRPKTDTYLTGFHSFLENFSPNQGYLGRQVEFKNQWVYNGVWNKITSARFTVDNTYRAKQRIDAIGGVTSNGYFLKNGGFFNEIVTPGSTFSFDNKNTAPDIDFEKLP
ncbi:DUF3472 domain-containing protein [Sphingobacterium lumbrici]|uniref:DUF3472 domain-containing protein n=1 Tax=Sphingobacterium lumbrici TaxID=2559600 RepID=UPI0011265BAC|nr:DUF3472 domain-containing protein [Sphingobacterium lumbrici]